MVDQREPEMNPDPLEERVLRRIPLEILAAGAVLALPAALLFGALNGAVLLAGALLAALSFAGLRSALARVLDRGRARAVRSGVLVYLARLLLIGASFFLIILLFPKSVIAFAAGFSAVVPVFLAEGAFTLARVKSWKS